MIINFQLGFLLFGLFIDVVIIWYAADLKSCLSKLSRSFVHNVIRNISLFVSVLLTGVLLPVVIFVFCCAFSGVLMSLNLSAQHFKCNKYMHDFLCHYACYFFVFMASMFCVANFLTITYCHYR